jgi:hypothetical protein
MFDKAPEHGGLKFRSGFVVNRHDLVSLFRGMMRTRRVALAKWIPVRLGQMRSVCREIMVNHGEYRY